MAENGNLTRGMQRAIPALLESNTVAEAAETAGLGERTIYRYLNDPAFKAELRRRQAQILDQTVATMVGGRAQALAALREAMTSDAASFSEQIRAAHYWLGHTQDAVELDVLVRRIEKLEALAMGANEEGGDE